MATKTQTITFQTKANVLQQIQNISLDCQTQFCEIHLSLLKKHQKLRESAIHWMMRSCSKNKFRKDTLFLAIKLMDEVVKSQSVNLFNEKQLQLTSACLVLISTKFNEVYPVSFQQLNLILDRHYNKEEFFLRQAQLLKILNFEIPEATVYTKLIHKLIETSHFSADKIKKHHGSIGSHDKQNCSANSNNIKVQNITEQNIIANTLKAIKNGECFKYGEEILSEALHSFMTNSKSKGYSIKIVKTNYIKTVLRKILLGQQKQPKKIENNKENKLNPESKGRKQSKMIIF